MKKVKKDTMKSERNRQAAAPDGDHPVKSLVSVDGFPPADT